jgi:hypothetical protein
VYRIPDPIANARPDRRSGGGSGGSRGGRLADVDDELAVDTVTRGPFEIRTLKIVES